MTQITAPVLSPPFLLAMDGSPSAHLAQKLVVTIAQTLQAEQTNNGRSLVTVLTVQPRRSSRSRRLPQTQSPPLIEPEQAPVATPADHAPKAMAVAAQPLSADEWLKAIQPFPADVSFKVETRQGRPAIEILNCARTLHAGLIAVGSRGIANRRGRLMGSVSAVIARYAPCSVLVARGATVPPATEPRLHHLLLVVNESPATQQAIATVRQLLPAGVRQLTILYAQQPLNADYLFGPFATPTPSWQLNQSLQDAQKEQGDGILEQARAAFSAPTVDVHTLRQIGDPGPLICQTAQQQQVDLIVLGGNAMQRWLRLPAGDGLFPLQSFWRSKPVDAEVVKPPPALRNTRLSAAEDYTLHHAPCPVLLCRSMHPASS